MGNRSNINLVGNTTQGQNLGAGDACVFKEKYAGNTLRFRSIVGSGDTTVTQTDEQIIIWSSGGTGGSGTGLTTAMNGLTDDGTNVCLGGTLITSTTIDANSNPFTVCSASTLCLQTCAGASLSMVDILGMYKFVQLSNGDVIPSRLSLSPAGIVCLSGGKSWVCLNGTVAPPYALSAGLITSADTFCNAELRICGCDNPSLYTSSHSQPINYAGDYSANFTNNSLVTKAWVLANATGGTGGGSITGGTNGLGYIGKDICLGGALTTSTAICGTDTNILRLEATGDYSGGGDEITPYLEFWGDSAITLRIDTTRSGDNYSTGLQIDDVGGKQETKLILTNPTGSSEINLNSCSTYGLSLSSTNGIYISGTTHLEKTPNIGSDSDSALTWDSGTTAIRRLPIIEEWVSTISGLTYMGQKYNYPTHSVFMD